ncbi:EAL domain-containing protein [Marinobacteraceae bacterium S3BR75-40.1]
MAKGDFDQSQNTLHWKDNDGLPVLLSPVVSPHSQRVHSFELHHLPKAQGGLSTATHYDLDWGLVKAAVRTATELQSQDAEAPPVTARLSPETLVDKLFPDTFRQLLDEHGLSPDQVQLAVTEQSLLDHTVPPASLHQLSDSGVQLILDDYLSLSSNLHVIQNRNIGVVKLGEPVTAKLHRSEIAQRFVRGLVTLTASVGKTLVVKGVENQRQLGFLEACGCRHFQGDYLSSPLPPEKVPQYLHQVARSGLPRP